MTELNFITLSKQMKDVSAETFGRLTAIGLVRTKPARWLCECECGNTSVVALGNLTSGHTTSCGCYNLQRIVETKTTHRLGGTPEHVSWAHIIQRTTNKESVDYKNYGGRGITVSDKWRYSFETFLDDMGNRPTPKHSIERIDNNLGYFKENCKWANRKAQARNKRSNVVIDFDGKSLCLAEWAEVTGISYYALYFRICRRGWPVERALTEPVRK